MQSAGQRHHHHRRLRASSHGDRRNAESTARALSRRTSVGDSRAAFEHSAPPRSAKRSGPQPGAGRRSHRRQRLPLRSHPGKRAPGVAALAAEIKQQRPPGAPSGRRRRNRANHRARNAQRRCGGHSLQRRLRRNLRKASSASARTGRDGTSEKSRLQRRSVSSFRCADLRACSAFALRLVLRSLLRVAIAASAQHRVHRLHRLLASPEQHLVEVQIILPPGAAQRDLQLPVWNALYQVRDFAQYVNWVRAKDRVRASPFRSAKLDKSRWQIRRRGRRRDRRISDLCRLLRTIRRAVEFASRVPQSCADSDVSGRRSQRAPERFVSATCPATGTSPPPLPHVRTASSAPRTTTASSILRSKSATSRKSDFDEAGGHFRVIVDADPADYDMDKTRRHTAQDRRRRHQLDERSPLRHLHVLLSLSARPSRRRHGARLLDRDRHQRRDDPAEPRTR